ncbi:uncharacterized protein LOC107001438 [Solanum pennellii]|uniref:Uncharacterized protein LOC107001438 n=1 Tax=Solanum pennellii TaxID=28526 RepID=A0ABM1UX14_SOLPN|nr:uncharacterized protein LOC107001438 [Solanum pennellii]
MIIVILLAPGKCLSMEELEQIEAQIPITLCKLEKVDMNPSKTLKYEMGQALKFPKHGLIQPGALAKELGHSFKLMSTTRVNAEQRTSIAKNRSYDVTTSKSINLEDNSFHVHPNFEEKEDNARQGVEINQHNLTSDARARGQSLGINV